MPIAMLEPGQVFAGRYRVIRLIAPGGMGAVFEAEHTGTERHVALKLLWPHIMEVQSAREKFELEAKVAARVQSEHIVHVLDAGFDEATRSPYLVMELLQGGTLAAFVEERRRVEPELTVRLLQQVAKGLDAAHSLRNAQGARTPLIHRDLKPENLLLVPQEEGPALVKILDFGISKVLSESRNMSHEIRGTPMYMAYEQVAAEKLSPQTDIWALGLIAYFMLTGRRYWKSANDPEATMQALFMEIVMAPMVPASQRLAEQGADFLLPADFDGWLERCIDRVPEQRFESASAAIIALEAALRVKAARAQASRKPSASVEALPSLARAPSAPIPETLTDVRASTAGSMPALESRSLASRPGLMSQLRARPLLGALALSAVVLATAALVIWRSGPASTGEARAQQLPPPGESSKAGARPEHTEPAVPPPQIEQHLSGTVHVERAKTAGSPPPAAAAPPAPPLEQTNTAELPQVRATHALQPKPSNVHPAAPGAHPAPVISRRVEPPERIELPKPAEKPRPQPAAAPLNPFDTR